MKAMIVLLAALASGSAFADCKNARILERPDIPNGSEATYEEMLKAQEAVQAYVASGAAYLNCAKPVPFAHNYLVERMERTATRFNEEREAFLQRREAVAVN